MKTQSCAVSINYVLHTQELCSAPTDFAVLITQGKDSFPIPRSCAQHKATKLCCFHEVSAPYPGAVLSTHPQCCADNPGEEFLLNIKKLCPAHIHKAVH